MKAVIYRDKVWTIELSLLRVINDLWIKTLLLFSLYIYFLHSAFGNDTTKTINKLSQRSGKLYVWICGVIDVLPQRTAHP